MLIFIVSLTFIRPNAICIVLDTNVQWFLSYIILLLHMFCRVPYFPSHLDYSLQSATLLRIPLVTIVFQPLWQNIYQNIYFSKHFWTNASIVFPKIDPGPLFLLPTNAVSTNQLFFPVFMFSLLMHYFVLCSISKSLAILKMLTFSICQY